MLDKLILYLICNPLKKRHYYYFIILLCGADGMWPKPLSRYYATCHMKDVLPL